MSTAVFGRTRLFEVEELKRIHGGHTLLAGPRRLRKIKDVRIESFAFIFKEILRGRGDSHLPNKNLSESDA